MLLASVNSEYSRIVTTVFSTTIAAKVWFATAAIILALVQITTGARIYGRLRPIVRLSDATVSRVHRARAPSTERKEHDHPGEQHDEGRAT